MPTNPDYIRTVTDRVRVIRESGITGTVPSELVQASASGIDPHLSPDAALQQVRRVAKALALPVEAVTTAVNHSSETPQFTFLGESRVNVLVLTLMLDKVR